MAFIPDEVGVRRPVLPELVLVGHVEREDVWVLVVAVEDAHAAEVRELAFRRPRGDHAGPGWRWRAETQEVRGIREDRLLLQTVGRDRTDLAQHVLAGVVNAITGAHERAPVAAHVPRDTEPRLPHVPLARDRAVGGEGRIA
jgi:hypothetical protein